MDFAREVATMSSSNVSIKAPVNYWYHGKSTNFSTGIH